MHCFLRLRNTLLVVLLALIALADVADAARPKPGAPRNRGFRLFAGVRGTMEVNRVSCGINSAKGEVCVDVTGSSVLGGGFWPRGTPDQYVFNSGLQVAGVIDPAAGFDWAGDTTGAFFFDPKGTTEHGEGVQPVYNTTDPDDFAFISDSTTTDPVALAARVPVGDANENLFNPLLRGRTAASQGDFWFLAWEGNPSLNASRLHPLGLLVETRGMGWNFPQGNEDIIYLIYTFYNITSLDPAAYAGVRPGMRDILLDQAQAFHDRNEASFGIDIPDAGYNITNLFAAFATDPDVAEATVNFASVSVPFAMGFTYEHTFSPASGWVFDPTIFGAPFFAGSGFFGVKYLKSPELSPGVEAGLTLYSNTINGGDFNDAQNAIQLYRYLSNNISPAAGDAPCNTGNPQQTSICFVNVTAPNDMRFFQSSGPLNLAPGQFGSIVVAYVFAAPRLTGSCSGPGTCDLTPGDATRMSSLATAGNVNPVDSVAGYLGFSDDGDGVVEQSDFQVAPRSLYGKALVAQQVFDGGFLLPFAPEAPNFFLIPGNNQVTVLWQPSATEANGDPFFQISSAPLNQEGAENLLFDPNYRQFDVEGYRVYRGRVDNPNELEVVAQFDYAGTVMPDFQGQVNPTTGCAPELGINTVTVVEGDTTFGCPVDFDSLVPGVAPTVSVDVPLVGQIIQVKRGERQALANGENIILVADTAITGAAGGCRNVQVCTLRDNAVPFVFVDRAPRNNLRYFYSVTAFDINSFQSGPSSLESARNTQATVPQAGASNYQNASNLTLNIVGRGVAQDSVISAEPTIDGATGRFSGPFPPANGGDLHFAGELASQVLSAPGVVSIVLDSLTLGSAYDLIPNVYYMTATGGDGSTFQFSFPVTQDQFDAEVTANAFFNGVPVDPDLAARYGGNASYALQAEMVQRIPGNYYTNSYGRGCINGAAGFDQGDGCNYNGSRWFDGPSPANNETAANPTAGNQANSGAPTVPSNFNNAGALTGVTNIWEDRGYQTVNNTFRQVEGALGGVARAADFNVYWGAGGTVDSVVDATHNIPVPFSPTVGPSWGILNAAGTGTASRDASTVLTSMDMGCVEPLKSFPVVGGATGFLACGEAAPYVLSQTAVPAPIGYMITGPAIQPSAGTGFIMYLPGHYFTFELAGGALPAQGTVWSLRTYTGAISGGQGQGGNQGAYVFTPQVRPFTIPGALARLSFDVTNQVVAATEDDLSRVHTVPDPYYVTNAFEQSTDTKILKFVNLPNDAIVRIYSSSGVLVRLLEHHATQFGGSLDWDVRNRNNQVVASGVYFYHVEAGGARRVGRFTVVNFAQ
jgi:hypothetical protein